jgi:hypothetical protein
VIVVMALLHGRDMITRKKHGQDVTYESLITGTAVLVCLAASGGEAQ